MNSDHIPFASGEDPLLRDVPLDHRVETLVFGVPVAFESNAAYVTDLVRTHFGPRANAISLEANEAGPPIRLRVVLEPSRLPAPVLDPVQFRIPDRDHALIRAPGIVGWLDLLGGEAAIYVEEETARALTHFTSTVIDGPMLTLLARRDRHPVHGAALRRGDAALILHAQSGTGKSTLCYAASLSGLEVLSDDVVRVQRAPELRIWGQPGHVQLLEEVRARFPALRAHGEVAVSGGGTLKHVVALPRSSPALFPFVRRARICLLSRSGGGVVCEAASPAEIARAVLDAPESRFDLDPDGQAAAVEALAAPGGWRVDLSDDPFDAIPLMHSLLEQV